MFEVHQTYTEREISEAIGTDAWPSGYEIIVQGNTGLLDAMDIDDWSNAEQDEDYPDGRTYVFDGEFENCLAFTEMRDDGFRRNDGAESLSIYTRDEYERVVQAEQDRREGK